MEKGFNVCCGYVTNAADSLPNFETVDPNKGDLGICLNCGALLVYIDGKRNITQLAGRQDIELLNSAQRKYIGRAQRYVRARGLIKNRSNS